MKVLCRAEHKTNYDATQSKYAKLLNELDRLDDERALLAAAEERYSADPKKYKSKLSALGLSLGMSIEEFK